MSQWIKFSDRLPAEADANEKGEVDLAEDNGEHRRGLWNWISPCRKDAVATWRANGFMAWRRLI